MPKKIRLSSDLDIPILHFLWLWKVSTTAIVGKKFYANTRSVAAYKRLRRLEAAEFVESRADFTGKCFVWTLAEDGFKAIRNKLPDLREEGFRSENIGHDLCANIVHLGDWLTDKPEGAEFFTEQELRRYNPVEYPDWIPESMLHRPDGYWRVPVGDLYKTVALEFEASRKTIHYYSLIGEFYRESKSVFQVVWAVPSVSSAQRLLRHLSADSDREEDFHNFILIKDLMRDGWNSDIRLGSETGKKLRELLVNSKGTCQSQVTDQCPIDTSKSPHRSGSCIKISPTEFRFR